MPCTCKQIKKENTGGAGNYKYTFECKRGNVKKTIEITSANDNEAKRLAELECEESLKGS